MQCRKLVYMKPSFVSGLNINSSSINLQVEPQFQITFAVNHINHGGCFDFESQMCPTGKLEKAFIRCYFR